MNFREIITTNLNPAPPDEPLTAFDTRFAGGRASILIAFREPLDTERLIVSLKLAMKKAPYFGGQIIGLGGDHPYVSAKAPAILLESSSSSEKMTNFGPSNSFTQKETQLAIPTPSEEFNSTIPALKIKLSNFRNGCILALTITHAFCDGRSLLHFLKIWSGIITGSPVEPFSSRTRAQVIQKTMQHPSEPSAKFPVASIEISRITALPSPAKRVFRITKKSLDRTRALTDAPSSISDNDYLHALLWKIATQCSDQSQGKSSISLVYAATKILGFEPTYLGNCLFRVSLKKEIEKILTADVASIAKDIRNTVHGINPGDIYQDLNFWRHHKVSRTLLPQTHVDVIKGGILINNLSKLPIYELDFGAGTPIWCEQTMENLPMRFASICPIPAYEAIDGYDVHVSLPATEMKKFQEIMHSCTEQTQS